jgi:voltage-gated sodium channel
MKKFCQNLAQNEAFQAFILFLILLTAVFMGLETIPDLVDRFESFFFFINYFSQWIFAFEICVRIVAYAPRINKFFKDSWNTFDFLIVGASFVPGVGSFALIARLLRVLRLLRVFSVSDRLRGFVDRMKESFDEVAYAGLIAIILGYIFTITGFYLFSQIDAPHWGTLSESFRSIFYMLLLQDVQRFVEPVVSVSKGYFIFFLLFYFVFISLFMSVLSAAIIQSVKEEK